MARRSGYRVQIGVRISAADKDFFSDRATEAGLEPSVAIRQILELMNQRMRAGCDFIDALHELKTAWRLHEQTEMDRRISAAQRAMDKISTGPAANDPFFVDAIERIEKFAAGGKS